VDQFSHWNIRILADNCSKDTLEMVRNVTSKASDVVIEESSIGNAGSLRKAIEWATEEENNQIIYFVEDDYIHESPSCQILTQGLEKSDYVTLYDHPDKYEFEYGYGEVTKVFKTRSSHWKWTISTTMTFATTSDVLRRDKDIWLKYTEKDHPHDHHIFTEIGFGKLSCCIPGVACHVDLTYSNENNKFLIDDFTVKFVEKYIYEETLKYIDPNDFPHIPIYPDPERNLMMKIGLLESAKSGFLQ